MPRKKSPAQSLSGDAITSVTHTAKRKNIPLAGLESNWKVEESPKLRYEYNPHLPPALRFSDDPAEADKLPPLVAKAAAGKAAMFQLEASPQVVCYARNDRMEFNIPYEFHDIAHVYEPDFLVKLADGVMLVLEIKGQFLEDTEMKHQAAQRWVSAVNHWGQLGRWDFMVCRDPQQLGGMLAGLVSGM
jgi:hypothetical protein